MGRFSKKKELKNTPNHRGAMVRELPVKKFYISFSEADFPPSVPFRHQHIPQSGNSSIHEGWGKSLAGDRDSDLPQINY